MLWTSTTRNLEVTAGCDQQESKLRTFFILPSSSHCPFSHSRIVFFSSVHTYNARHVGELASYNDELTRRNAAISTTSASMFPSRP